MIHPSTFLSRALLADAIFSGVSAVGLALGAGLLAPFFNLPEALLRETGLFLIAYAALVGWLGTRSSVPKALVLVLIASNAAWTLARSLCMPEPVVHDTGLFVFAHVQTFENKVGKSLCPLRLLRRIRARFQA